MLFFNVRQKVAFLAGNMRTIFARIFRLIDSMNCFIVLIEAMQTAVALFADFTSEVGLTFACDCGPG